MKLAAVFACAGLACCANATVTTYNSLADYLANSTGTNTVEGFDNAPWIDFDNPNPTSNLGVTWSTPEILFGTTAGSVSGTRALSPLDNGDTLDELNVLLPANIGSIGLWASTFGQNHNVEVRALNVAGDIVGILTISGTSGNNFNFGGLVSTVEPIAGLQILSTSLPGVEDDFMIDDFHFAVIPAPSALAMLGAAGLAALRRRR